MTFVDAIRTCFQKYTDFSGRAGLPEYWWFFLFQLVVYVVANLIGDVVVYLVALALLLPGLAVGVRRLHDTGRSGWFLLLGLIPVIGTIILIVFLASKGESASNQYGDPPSPAPAAA